MRTLTKHLSHPGRPVMFVRHPESRAPGLAYIGWKTARFAMLLATLPLLPLRLSVVVLALVSSGARQPWPAPLRGHGIHQRTAPFPD